MSSASLPLAFTPVLDDQTLARLHRRATLAARLLGFTASSLAFAFGLWLILAAPGFLTDAGTAPGRHAARVAVRGS